MAPLYSLTGPVPAKTPVHCKNSRRTLRNRWPARLARERGLELGDVLFGHAAEEGEPRVRERAEAGQARARAALAKQRGAGERVRTAAGPRREKR